MRLSSFLLVSFVGFIGVKTQSLPYPDSPFFIEHAHTEIVASVSTNEPTDGGSIFIEPEKNVNDPNKVYELWMWTHETYIQNQGTNLYLATKVDPGQDITKGTPVVQSSTPQTWEYYNGVLRVPGKPYGITLDNGSETTGTSLVIADLDIFDKNQQFRLERFVEDQQCGPINQ